MRRADESDQFFVKKKHQKPYCRLLDNKKPVVSLLAVVRVDKDKVVQIIVATADEVLTLRKHYNKDKIIYSC